jgi:two-component system sensor histidine kinase YesM
MCSHSIFVTITIKEEKDTYTVKVIDNGKGMNPNKLEELNARLERESYSTKSISLLNIKRRLHLLYGEKAIFNIESLPGSYTVITMTIPKEGKK